MERLTDAPEIDRSGLQWFNVSGALSLAGLRGRLVILDFWTYCCINCMQLLPSLKRVEERFPGELVVVGVHSPKFEAERDGANVAQAIARYGITHPVVHDPTMSIWQAYGVRAWPTLVFISPDGKVLGHAPGEPDPERLFRSVSEIIEKGKAEGKVRPGVLNLTLAGDAPGRFAFPGKLKPLPGGNGERCWALADAGHHQIVVLDDDGKELRRFGSGEAGLQDGGPGTARFNGPQGLACTADAIYVADTFNHAIRKIELTKGQVSTLAGDGHRGGVLSEKNPARSAALASVWDLEISGRRLFFANAGTHQLGELDLAVDIVGPLAGNGGENLVDGPAAAALLAQPSGLALSRDGSRLAFADSETSAVRMLNLSGESRVETIVGTGLFDFAHRNGAFAEARFQHPLGVAWLDETRILVADSYNAALRLIDLAAGQVGDFGAGDFTCQDPLCLPLAEPAGVAADGADRVLVADTNNHRLLEFKLSEMSYRTWAS